MNKMIAFWAVFLLLSGMALVEASYNSMTGNVVWMNTNYGKNYIPTKPLIKPVKLDALQWPPYLHLCRTIRSKYDCMSSHCLWMRNNQCSPLPK